MTNQKIVFFDGVCHLCNGFVRWVIVRDRKRIFKYAPLQGSTFKKAKEDFRVTTEVLDSVVLLDGGFLFQKSEAVLRVLVDLGGVWALAKVFRVIPRALRDYIYDFIAANRYGWFGRDEYCRLPAADEKAHFLD